MVWYMKSLSFSLSFILSFFLIYIYIYIYNWKNVKIAILTTFSMNLKFWRRLLQPKRSTSTFIINSSKFGLFSFFNFLHTVWFISLFTSGSGDLGSILARVIPKTLKKWYLIPTCLTLSNIKYISRVKWSNAGKGVAPSPTFRCGSYWKGSLLVALDYGRQLYFYIYI